MTTTIRDTTTQITTEGKAIKVIPATKSLHPERDGVEPTRDKIRVTAYCRVSTTLEEQQGSYDLQKKYYETFINNNPAWEPVGVYGDEGKSGTSLKGRTGFLEMMDDVRAGKIDYIITKATSRFGRNNADFIAILNELDSYDLKVVKRLQKTVKCSAVNVIAEKATNKRNDTNVALAPVNYIPCYLL